MDELDDLLARIREPIIHWKVTPQTYSELFSKLLLDSRQRGATHIHLHCTSRDLVVRYRVDGKLQLRAILPNEATTGLIDEIRSRARLDCGEWRRPQVSRIRSVIGDLELLIRVDVTPSWQGPSVVLSFESESNVCLQLHELGLLPDQKSQITHMLQRRRGFFVISGLAYSGRRTMGHAVLMAAKNLGKEVLSLEWGVQRFLPGILQVDFDAIPKFSQSEWVQAALRRHPDVLFIEHPGNTETIGNVVGAARSNCLILAAMSRPVHLFVDRLEALGVPRHASADALIGGILQAVIPKVCGACATPYVPSSGELRDLRIRSAKPHELLFVRGKGCGLCGGTGRHGMLGVHEVVRMTDELRELFCLRKDWDELHSELRSRGMTTIYQSAIHKVVTRQISSEIAYRFRHGFFFSGDPDTWTEVDPETGLVQPTS